MPGTLLERASHCQGCGKFMGHPSYQDLEKLINAERAAGYEIVFYCDRCNDAFTKWYRERHGVDPMPSCVLGKLH